MNRLQRSRKCHGRYVTFQLAEVPIPRARSPRSCISLTGCGRPTGRHDGSRFGRVPVSRQRSDGTSVSKRALPARNWRRNGRSIAKSANRPRRSPQNANQEINRLRQPNVLAFLGLLEVLTGKSRFIAPDENRDSFIGLALTWSRRGDR